MHDYTNTCDRKFLARDFAVIGKVRSNNSDLACDRIEYTRLQIAEGAFCWSDQACFSKGYLSGPGSRQASSLRNSWVGVVGRTPRGSCNNTLLRRVLRRFFEGDAS